MVDKKYQSYGHWPSEITPGTFANLLKLSEPVWGQDGALYWRERSSALTGIRMVEPESGEMRVLTGDLDIGGELLYGGGGYAAGADSLFVVDKKSHQLFQIHPGNNASVQVTSNLVKAASPKISPDGRFILFVHSDGEDDRLYIHSLSGSQSPQPISLNSDFINFPRWHPSGGRIAWVSWDHPHMPWDSSSLWIADLDYSAGPGLNSISLVAGGEGISVLQPEFSSNGRFLTYISDKDGWWQIYLFDLDKGEHQQLTRNKGEHGLPPWLQDQRSYQISPDSNRLYFLRAFEANRSLWTFDLSAGEEKEIQLDENYTWLEDISLSPAGDEIALIASAADLPPRLILVGLDGRTEIVRSSAQHPLPRKTFSIPKPRSWKGKDGKEVHGLFYAPQNPKFTGRGKPPLLVIIHSGPTRQKSLEFQPRTQYFTSRGYAVLEVNYRGSSGYGREYRQALAGNWGVIDVEDCVSGAIQITERGLADREKMVVMGSSSGGLTVYQILVKYPGMFRAGVCLYGIVNHITLLHNPPKFERHYSEWLIGPYPEAEKLYHQRSPIFFADQIQDPTAIFQGGRDSIVPQDQAEQMVAELKRNQVPFLYRLYPEEGHSFKQISTLEDFYSQLGEFLADHLTS